MYRLGNFVDLAYSEHEETEMLAVFTYANELGFEPGLNSPLSMVNTPTSRSHYPDSASALDFKDAAALNLVITM